MDLVGVNHSFLRKSFEVDFVCEVEEAVALGFPSRIRAKNVAVRRSHEGDGANHVNAPRVQNASHLDDFMCCASDQYIEERLTYLGNCRSAIEPVAKDRCSISRKFHPLNGNFWIAAA